MLRAESGPEGVFATATFVFLARFARARSAARDEGGFYGLGLGLFCGFFLNRARQPPYGLCALILNRARWPPYGLCALHRVFRKLPLTLIEILFQESVHCHRLFDCDLGRVEVFGLEAPKFLERAVEGALGCRAGAVDRDLEAVEFFVGEIFGGSDLERGAAAEAPGGMDDFAGESLLERRCRGEFGHVAGLELIKDVLFAGADEVGDREQAMFGCVLRDAGAAFGRDRAAGVSGVLAIGQDLSGGSHRRRSKKHN